MNLQSITVGQYFPGQSSIHRLDPRTKLIAVLVLSIAVFVPKAWGGLALIAAFTSTVTALSGVPFKFLLRGLRPIVVFLLIALLFNAFMTPGEALFHVGRWTVTREGIMTSLFTSARLILLVITASLLTLTTSPIRLTDGLESLMRPFTAVGVPAHELALMMTIALRFIPTLLEEADRIVKAQSARGADFQSGNVVARFRAMIPVLIPLFVAAFRRADELATAMEARGYRGGRGRTKMKALIMGMGDVVGFMAIAVVVGGVLWLRTRGMG